jgi:hypothetical protein
MKCMQKSMSSMPVCYIQYIYIYVIHFACGSGWVRNLASDIKGGTYTEGV